MNKQIDNVMTKLKESWNSLDSQSLEEIQEIISGLGTKTEYSYSDKEFGFVLNVYSESKETYRLPHNHGKGWVIYSVLEGSVEMGNYFHWEKPNSESKLILKGKIILNSSDVKMYYPGEIHDTKCLSENALILRLTSCDLKVEEAEGRMKRFKISQSCSL